MGEEEAVDEREGESWEAGSNEEGGKLNEILKRLDPSSSSPSTLSRPFYLDELPPTSSISLCRILKDLQLLRWIEGDLNLLLVEEGVE